MMENLAQGEKLNIIITCASGVERTVKTELERLGYPSAPAINGAIEFEGDSLAVARCNIFLRSADRVYIKLASFSAETFDQLFDGASEVRWQDYLPKNAKIIVNGKCVKSKLFAVSACQSIIKKAIVNSLTRTYKVARLSEMGTEYAVEFWVFKDKVTLMLNTSGVGLHKRGYRDLVGIAPIKETLASALLLMSDFYWERPFVDPFCGSGTLVIEGAKIALNIAPNLQRKFAFNDWKNFDKSLYDLAVTEARDKEKRDRKIDFCGSDIDEKAIKLAKRHAIRAEIADKISFIRRDVKDFVPSSPRGTIVTNPPYGERVYDIREAEECYKNLGKALKGYDGWSAFVITSAKSFPKYFGRKPDRERKLYNSNKECKFYYYYSKKENGND
ncbi:MAG: class I SAM-dependent RNA methyltransferase [Clostridia bacterium]|nr:class I SAM-dependent RNA methyltransferase [Clostridia bacterium]